MTLQPEHPDFTSAALGEASLDELADYQAAVSGNPAFQSEADSLLHTACLLRAALQSEAVHSLSPAQRAAVFTGQTAPPSVTHANGNHRQSAAVSRHRGGSRVAVWKPILATAGIAAAIALGIFLFPALSGPRNASESTPAGIPGITLNPGPAVPPSSSPALGPPVRPKNETFLQPGSTIEGPVTFPIPQSIATVPPEIEIIPTSPAKLRDLSPPRAPAPGSRQPGNSIAAPPAGRSTR